ncbi:Hypothetical protein BAAA_6000111 [Brucella abortus str. 2308 A]|nr:Hypothetical protein BAAA_6000111 [Brucella abortus str. 2308 A]
MFRILAGNACGRVLMIGPINLEDSGCFSLGQSVFWKAAFQRFLS